nr:sugar ABC transporter permease [Enterovibrio nigricans]
MNHYAELQRRRQHLYGWFLLTPAAILLSLFAFYPSAATLWESLFSKGTRRRPSEFSGLENYVDLFNDPTFWIVVKNNLFYAAMTIPLSIIIALTMALWANGKISGKGFVRTAYFTPTVLPMIAAANLWLFFYTPDLGVLDQIGAFFGFESVNWSWETENRIVGSDYCDDLERSRFFYDLLPCRASNYTCGLQGSCRY